MNTMVLRSEVSGYFKQTNGETVFYSFLHDIETALIKGINAIYVLAKIGKRSINSACDNTYTTLNVTANECAPTQCEKSGENTEGKPKKNEGWIKTTKCVPMSCFYKKQNNKGKIIIIRTSITIDTIFCAMMQKFNWTMKRMRPK